MPSIFDFSDAYSWLMFGFLAGLLAYWLYRRLFGGHHHYAAQLADFSAQLDASNQQLAITGTTHAAELAALRQDADNEASKANYYVAEFNSLSAAYQALTKDTSSNSGLVTKLQSDYAMACSEADRETTRLNSELESAKTEANKQRAEANSLIASIEAAYKEEIGSLKSQLSAVPDTSGEVSSLNSEVSRLNSELAKLKTAAPADVSGYTDEITGLKDEAAKLAAALETARAMEQSAALEHHATKNDLRQVRTALEETSLIVAQRHGEIEQLKAKLAAMPADLDNYRRFKDALDAANRIAAGLPEKA